MHSGGKAHVRRQRVRALAGRLPRWNRRALLALAVLLGATACQPNTISASGDEVHHLWMVYLIASIVVFVLEAGAIIGFAFKFRQRRHQDEQEPVPQIHGNNRLELTWTIVPAVLLFTLLGISLHEYSQIEQNPHPRLTVDVTAYQWQWSFAYADGNGKPYGVTQQAEGQTQGPVLYLPVGEKIRFVIKSADVIHSFYVPAFFWKRDAIPGFTNTYTQVIDRSAAGHTYAGACAELCGLEHSQMRFTLAPLTQVAFHQWLTSQESTQAKAAACSPSGTTLKLSAHNIHYSTSCLAAPAGKPFTITFDNMDKGVPHNVAIYSDSTASKVLFRGQIVTGPKTVTYHVPALPAGTYYFRCDVHPTAMHGTFVVK
ncbi:MAG TPA: cytochrome c oxidase subunit II [Nocardioidaceae bacterium]|nr:cytochrome c oxidase subunit II [Nocardioidaceae bacterium]